MFKAVVIGHLGADAEVKVVNGVEFVAMRVADTSTWKDGEGVKHTSTDWIDVTLSKDSLVRDYLKKGTLIYARGNISKRIYSSEKDKCQKVGITIHAAELQLLSAQKKEDVKDEQKYEGF